MKTLALAGLAVVALSACGSLPGTQGSAKTYEIDQARMAQVERVATKNGVRVIWVSAPTRVVRGG